ncbi:MAG TPA: ATP-dependent dethiobiotin synthetase BioD, partial [Planctomycetaceae bacterium]|nr:ATP-dependent dethiobiotin synthetase BioD [Planctomycetaceae bacterium]
VDFLVVEGVGGLLAPMSESELVADVACDLGFPLLLVARRSLGTINHTLLTLEAASKRGLAVAGIVLNQPLPTEVADLSVDSNAAELARRCAAPIIAILPHETTAALRHPSPLSKIDWVQLMSAGSDAR